MQTTSLMFGGLWIIHSEVLEYGFYILKLYSVFLKLQEVKFIFLNFRV